MKYFLDTYAIIEIIRANPKYSRYIEEDCVTLKENLAELSYSLIREGNEEVLKHNFEIYSRIAVGLPEDIIIDAMRFRFLNKGKNLSYIDCLGYVYARSNGMKFLTGDKEFSGMENVEFVK